MGRFIGRYKCWRSMRNGTETALLRVPFDRIVKRNKVSISFILYSIRTLRARLLKIQFGRFVEILFSRPKYLPSRQACYILHWHLLIKKHDIWTWSTFYRFQKEGRLRVPMRLCLCVRSACTCTCTFFHFVCNIV